MPKKVPPSGLLSKHSTDRPKNTLRPGSIDPSFGASWCTQQLRTQAKSLPSVANSQRWRTNTKQTEMHTNMIKGRTDCHFPLYWSSEWGTEIPETCFNCWNQREMEVFPGVRSEENCSSATSGLITYCTEECMPMDWSWLLSPHRACQKITRLEQEGWVKEPVSTL